MSETKKYETTRKNYTFDPAKLIGSLAIACGLVGGAGLIAESIHNLKPAIDNHVEFAKGSIVVNERAVEFGAITKGYEVKKKAIK